MTETRSPASPIDYSIHDDVSLALALAAEADLITVDRFEAIDLSIETKLDNTPVTDADRRTEAVIREGILEARPHDAIFGEEYGSEGVSRREWIIDPIDGTANFMRGVPIWGTLIALVIDGVPVVGVVSAPALGRRWWGATGLGAFVSVAHGEPRPLAVSGVASIEEASLSYNSIKGWDDAGYLDELVALTRRVRRARAIGDMWSYMLVAEGAIDIAGEFDLQPYDMAAIVPIIEGAGGRFTSIDGHDGPWHGSALVTNGLLHHEVLSVLARD